MSLKKYSMIMVMVLANTSTVFYTTGKHISKITDLAAVTYFTDIYDYYRIVKLQKFGRQPKEPKKLAKRIELKKTLCHNIFSAPFFWMKQEEPLDVNLQSVQLNLFMYHKEIFKAIFVHREDLLSRTINLNDLEYDNSYQNYPVHLQRANATEFVFCCPVWNNEFKTMKQYFVSEEYNMNLIDKKEIAGRFIFLQGTDKHLKIEALAEESAASSTLVNPKLAEMYYAKRRKKDGRTVKALMDPVCKLAPANKLRLCASIFVSGVMRSRYYFLPDFNNLTYKDCTEKRISFVTDESTSVKVITKITRGYIDYARVYDEWVIGCKVMSIGQDDQLSQSTYFISRGDVKNSVFGYVSEPENGKTLIVDNYFNNVSMVADLNDAFDIRYETVESDTASDSSFTSAKSYWSCIEDSAGTSQLAIREN